jgi:hypothetical protein
MAVALSTMSLIPAASPSIAAPQAAALTQTLPNCSNYPPRPAVVTVTYSRLGHGTIIIVVHVTHGVGCPISGGQVIFKRGVLSLGTRTTGKYGFASTFSAPKFAGWYLYTVTYNGVTSRIWVHMPGTHPHPGP